MGPGMKGSMQGGLREERGLLLVVVDCIHIFLYW